MQSEYTINYNLAVFLELTFQAVSWLVKSQVSTSARTLCCIANVFYSNIPRFSRPQQTVLKFELHVFYKLCSLFPPQMLWSFQVTRYEHGTFLFYPNRISFSIETWPSADKDFVSLNGLKFLTTATTAVLPHLLICLWQPARIISIMFSCTDQKPFDCNHASFINLILSTLPLWTQRMTYYQVV